MLTSHNRHVSIPNFGFVLLPVTPASSKPTLPKDAPTKPVVMRKSDPTIPRQAASLTASRPEEAPNAPAAMRSSAPAPVTKLSSPTTIIQAPTAAPVKTSEKQLTKAEIAAAATRARMAEIMGPRSRQAPSSGAKGKGAATSSKGDEVKSGEGDKEMSESKGEIEINLMD